MNGRVIDRTEQGALLASFSATAFRFETRRAYNVPYEQDDFARFLRGDNDPPTGAWWTGWLDQIDQLTHHEGKTIGRVRVVDDPPTDYQRWELSLTPWNIHAGEDIRWLPRSVAHDIGLPTGYDWWLLDDRQLIVLEFNDADEVATRTLVTDPGIIARHRAWRDLAIAQAHSAGSLAA
jgi:hypothetical protein